jgi:hypothetical protein
MMDTHSYVYILQIQPGREHGRLIWEVAFNRPPTTAEAIRHIQDQRRGPAAVDVDFAAACVEALRDMGIPESYRAGSQGIESWEQHDDDHAVARIELRLMRLVPLPYLQDNLGITNEVHFPDEG